MPTKASKSSAAKPSKAKPTAAELLLSKIKPTATAKSKPTTAPAKNGKKPNGATKANSNGKIVPEKKVNGNGKSPTEKKVSGNGKATVGSKVNGNGKTGNKVNGAAKTNSNKGTGNKEKTKTTTKTVNSATKSPVGVNKAPKPTKSSKPEPTKVTKAAATKASITKVQGKAEFKEMTTTKTVLKPTTKKFSTPTLAPVQPTQHKSTKSKIMDTNIKSQHKPFPPFGKTQLSGTAVPAKRTNGYQQVQHEGSCLGLNAWICMPHPSSLFTSTVHHPDLQQNFCETFSFCIFTSLICLGG